MSRELYVPAPGFMEGPAMMQLQLLPMVSNPFEAALMPYLMSKPPLVWMEYFGFTLTWSAANNNQVTANASGVQAQRNLDPSIDYILKRLTIVAAVSAGSPILTQPNLTLNLTDLSGSTNFTDTDHHVGLWCGQYRNADPVDLPFPKYLRGNNGILGKISNLDATTYTRVDIGLEGVRVTWLNERIASRGSVFGVNP